MFQNLKNYYLSSNSTELTLILIHSSTHIPTINMNDSSHIRVNVAGGVYNNGRSFTKAKWYQIVLEYERILSQKGRCTVIYIFRNLKNYYLSSNSTELTIILIHSSTQIPIINMNDSSRIRFNAA